MAGNAGGIRAGKAYVEMGLDKSALEKELDAVGAKFKNFGASIAKIGASIGAAGAAITAPMTMAVKVFADSGAELAIMAQRTGMSAEALSILRFAADETGGSLADVGLAVRTMDRMISGARMGVKAAAGAFAEVGLNVNELAKLSPDERFGRIAKAIAKIPDPASRAAMAMLMFGRGGMVLLPFIENFKKLVGQANEFGLIAEGPTTQAALELRQAMTLLEKVIGSVIRSVGGALAPTWTQWYINMARLGAGVKKFINDNKPLMEVVYKVGLVLSVAGTVMTAFGGSLMAVGAILPVIGSVLSTIGSAFLFLISPVGLVLTGIVGLTAAWLTFTASGKATVAFLGDTFRSLLVTATGVFHGIVDAIAGGDLGLVARVAWAFLKLEWAKGMAWVVDTLDRWVPSISSAFGWITDKIQSISIDIWAWLQKTWEQGCNKLVELFDQLGAKVAMTFLSLMGPIAQVAGVLGIDIQSAVDNAIKSLTGGAAGAAERKAALQQRLNDIEANRQHDQADVQDKRANANEEDKRKPSMFDTWSIWADIMREGAQKELDAAETEAAMARRRAQKPVPNLGLTAGFDADEISEGMQHAMQKVDVSGTFSGAALRGMGAGSSVQDDQLKTQKSMARSLDDLNRKADMGRWVFGN